MGNKISFKTCKICGSEDWEPLFSKDNYNFIKCKNCFLVNISPIPSVLALDKYYLSKNKSGLNYDTNQYKLKKYVDYSFCNHIISKTRLNTDDYILDIGCYCGQLLDAFKDKGYKNLYGIEMQKKAFQISKSKHKNMFNITLEDFSNDDRYLNKFDYIVASGLIEHLRDPNILIEKSKLLLKYNGYLIIQTPFSDSLFARVLSKYWPPYTAPEHIFYFSKKSINILLSKNNFSPPVIHKHFKKLRIDYVLKMFRTFGTNLLPLILLIEKILPKFIKKLYLYFYGGEKILITQKKD